MTNITTSKTLLEEILGSEITSQTQRSVSQGSNNFEIISTELYNSLIEYFGSGAPLFRTKIPLNRLMRYKDGSYSSMERSLNSERFSRHNGYEILHGMQLANDIMSYVIPQLNFRLVSLYSDLINQNSEYLNQIQDFFIIPEVSKLKSIAEYIRDVADDISQISRSSNLSIATLTNIQQRRIDLKQTFHTFLERLQQSANSVAFDPQNIANNYLIARHALSYFIVSLVLECIISGNLDDSSIIRMKGRVENCLTELNDITSRLSGELKRRQFSNNNEINSIDWFYRWSYDYVSQQRRANLSYQNDDIEYIHQNTLQYFNIEEEIRRLEAFIQSRSTLLGNIEIRPSKE